MKIGTCPQCGADTFPHPDGHAWCERAICGWEATETLEPHLRPQPDAERERFHRGNYWPVIHFGEFTASQDRITAIGPWAFDRSSGMTWGDEWTAIGRQAYELSLLPVLEPDIALVQERRVFGWLR